LPTTRFGVDKIVSRLRSALGVVGRALARLRPASVSARSPNGIVCQTGDLTIAFVGRLQWAARGRSSAHAQLFGGPRTKVDKPYAIEDRLVFYG
jgi:hypothetical protein